MDNKKKERSQTKYLKPLKKGDPFAAEIGRKGGKISKRQRSIKTILKYLMQQDPEKVFTLNKDDKLVMKVLRKLDCKTAKDLIMWKLATKAKDGDLQAIKMLSDHIGEDPGSLLKIAGSEEHPPIAVDALHRMSVEELEELSNLL